jgi:hypothetical protein
MIEEVESIHAELEVHSFRQLGILHSGQINIRETRAREGIPPQISKSGRGRVCRSRKHGCRVCEPAPGFPVITSGPVMVSRTLLGTPVSVAVPSTTLNGFPLWAVMMVANSHPATTRLPLKGSS